MSRVQLALNVSDVDAAATTRLQGEGLDTATEDNVTCCYAVQDKVWVHDPDQAPWEIYTVLADAGQLSPSPAESAEQAASCSTSPTDEFGAPVAVGPCC